MKGTKAIEMIALDFPGRDKLLKEPYITDTQDMAEWCLAICHEKIADGVPYLVWGHSVGTWVGFEFMMLARQIGLPSPKAAFLNAFPGPHMPASRRKWQRSRTLNSAEMKKELMSWDETHFGGAGKVVFDEPNWANTWEPMMRADFQLYDEYVFKHAGAPKFDFPLHCWHMEQEKLNTQDMIELWKDWTSADFDTCVMKEMGHLTCFYKPEFKKVFFEKVQALIVKYSGL
jgi:surfactin synthase thioesterase subunit